MLYIPNELVKEVRNIDLLTYLRKENPLDLVSLGKDEYCLRSHDSLKISNGLWHWFSRGVGGRSALDYLIKVEGYSFMDAVQKLTGGKYSLTPIEALQKKESSQKEIKTLILPEKYDNDERVVHYLTKKRRIDPLIVQDFINTGDIYENRYIDKKSGYAFTNAVFIGRDEKRIIRQASIRGIDSEFKGEASGSDKAYSFSAGSNDKRYSVHIYESAIDLLSYLTLLKQYGQDPYRDHHISLSGIYQPKKNNAEQQIPLSLDRFLKTHPEIEKVILHLDNDSAGRLAASSLISSLSRKGINTVDAPPETEKDVNDYLLRGRERERAYCR